MRHEVRSAALGPADNPALARMCPTPASVCLTLEMLLGGRRSSGSTSRRRSGRSGGRATCGSSRARKGIRCAPNPPPPNSSHGASRSHSHPGGNPGANIKTISHKYYIREEEFECELTKETIYLPLGCLQGGTAAELHAPTACAYVKRSCLSI